MYLNPKQRRSFASPGAVVPVSPRNGVRQHDVFGRAMGELVQEGLGQFNGQKHRVQELHHEMSPAPRALHNCETLLHVMGCYG